jgi:acrylyl-CoA reductase (NADPH)/3-hydroxypropionyl-CoA dehydratase/3-hydroxypropionyl-CoA synthetase
VQESQEIGSDRKAGAGAPPATAPAATRTPVTGLRIEKGVATLTLARPAARNALTLEMVERLHAALDRIESDPSVRLVVLRGEGEHFCSGADVKAFLKSVESGAPEEADFFLAREYALDLRLERLPVPLLVIADGITMGGGLGLGFGGYLVATPRTRFAMPESRIGFLPDIGATWELKRRLGLPLARYFAWTAETWDGEQAVRWGFADALVAPEKVDDLIASLARAARGETGQRLNGSAEVAFLHARVAGGVPAFQGRWNHRPVRAVEPPRMRWARRHFDQPTPPDVLRSLEKGAASADDTEESDWARETLELLKRRSPVSIWAADLLLRMDHEALASEASTTGGADRLEYLREALASAEVEAGEIARLERPRPRELALAVEFLFATALFRHPDFAEGTRAFRERREPSFPSRAEPLGVHRALFSDQAGWTLLRHAARLARDPFWLEIARQELDWVRPPLRGYDGAAFPRACWFADGTLNASVEAVDRWVARGRGDRTAFIWEGDRIDSDRRPLEQRSITYGALLEEVRRATAALRTLGLRRGDPLVLYMPNIIETCVAQLAAARAGLVYHPVFAGFAREELADRLHMMGARVLITADGAFRKGEVIQYKRDYVDPALRDFVPVEEGLAAVAEVLGRRNADPQGAVLADLRALLADKVTVEKTKLRLMLARALAARRGGAAGTPGGAGGGAGTAGASGGADAASDAAAGGGSATGRRETLESILLAGGGGDGAADGGGFMQRIGRAAAFLDRTAEPEEELTPEELALGSGETALLREIAARLDVIRGRVEKVIVLRRLGTRAEGKWTAGRDVAYEEFLEGRAGALVDAASGGGAPRTGKRGAAADGIAAGADPEPMEAEDPLFVMFTSGSTGKPKGLVHTHGGFLARLPFLLRTVFGLSRDDRILTVADPGWITGQSFACWGPLTYGMTAVLPGFVPSEDRLWAAIERYRVTFLKTGVTGIRAAMGDDPELIRAHDLSSLRADPRRYTSCSCAEPLDAAVQAWWETHIGPMHNCWWRTEDSGPETGASPMAHPQTPDAAARPLPWAEFGLFVVRDEDGGRTPPRRAHAGEKGTVFVRGNPGIARGTWARDGDWRSDPRYRDIYHADVPGWHNTGDAAVANPDGTLTFLGRDDEVLNVSGHRVGTQEIEGAVRGHAAVGNVAAIGIPAEIRGDSPVLFVVLRSGHLPSGLLDNQLREAVAESKGAHVAPTADFVFYVPALPVTKSGKILRRFLKYAAALDRDTLAAILGRLRDRRLRAGLASADRETLDALFPALERQGRSLRLGSVATVDRMSVLFDILLAVARRREIDIPAEPAGPPAAGGAAAPGQPAASAPAAARSAEAGTPVDAEAGDASLRYRPFTAPAEEIHALGRTDFRPGIDPLPRAQEAWAMVRDAFGRPVHGEPEKSLVRIVEPVPCEPAPNEVIVQNLFAGSTHNVLHALLADPVSPFEWHRQPWHVLGSGAACRVVACGREVERQGLFHPGELAINFPATYRLLDPKVSEDAMHAGFEIQGFETPGGTLRPFDRLQATQLLPLPKGLTLEQGASFMLNLVTVYRALTLKLAVRPGQTLLVEGATGGTGAHAVEMGRLLGARVTGIVSSAERGRQAQEAGAAAWLDRAAPGFKELWTTVPDDRRAWEEWEAAGEPLVRAMRERNDGRLAEAVVSFTGRPAFGRLVQLLEEGGRLAFFGAFAGYCLRFLGKESVATGSAAGPVPGSVAPAAMFERAGLRPGMGVLVHYGAGETADGGDDPLALAAIRAASERGARVVALTNTDLQGARLNRDPEIAARLAGAVSLESLKRGSRFEWPDRMPDYDRDPGRYEHYENYTLKPLAAAVGRLLRTPLEPRGTPDLILARGDEDTLAADLFMVRPFTGAVVVAEPRRRPYTIYAPQVWMRQRRLLFPSFEILGSHMGNPQQGREVIEWIARGLIGVRPPRVFEAGEAPAAFQAMHENKVNGSFVVHLTAPGRNLATEREIDERNGALFLDEKYVTVRLDEVRGTGRRIARVTLRGDAGRPPALARDAVYQIGDVFGRLQGDERLAAVILTGEGSIAFLAGQDLRQLYDEVEDVAAALQIARDAQRIFDAVEAFPRPVLAVVNGVALGGGHELLMCAHHRIAARAPRVRLGQPEIVLNIIPGFAGTQRLTRLLIDRLGLERGVREALEMILTGRHYEAGEALALGLLEELVDTDPLRRAYALAAAHARGDRGPLAAALETRRAARASWSRPVPLSPGFLDGDARLRLLLRQALDPGIGRAAPAVRALEATLHGLRHGFEAGCEREAHLFAALVADERHGRRGIRRFLDRQEPPPLPPPRPASLAEPMTESNDGRDEGR